MSAQVVNQLKLVGPAGTNKVMAGELSRLARRASLARELGKPRKEGLGALSYPFHAVVANLAVHYHRTSVRVLWDLYTSTANRLEPLYEGLRPLVEQEQRSFLKQDLSISVQARGVEEFAAGGRQVVGTVKNALVEGAASQGLRLRVQPEEPDLNILVRLHEGTLTVSVDLAGRPMNQRGYRSAAGPAPLRESLAAVLTMLARHDGRSEMLLDPMAGSGTIPIEAACMAQARGVWVPPRKPACESMDEFADLQNPTGPPLFEDTRPFCIANDLHPNAHDLAKTHAKRAGVEAFVHCLEGDFRNLSPEGVFELGEARGFDRKSGLILSNPPYGERMDDPDLISLYGELGHYCRQFSGWRAGFLVANPEFEHAFGGQPRIKKPLANGALRAYFFLYDL